MLEGLHTELTGRIIGAAMEIHRALGPGLDEKIYENALCIEFSLLGISIEQQKRHAVFYKEQSVGTAITDLIVDGRVILETKVADAIHPNHVAQLLSYLNLTGIQVGLLLNFKNSSLQFKRVTLSKPKNPISAQSAESPNLR